MTVNDDMIYDIMNCLDLQSTSQCNFSASDSRAIGALYALVMYCIVIVEFTHDTGGNQSSVCVHSHQISRRERNKRRSKNEGDRVERWRRTKRGISIDFRASHKVLAPAVQDK
jgi:hypothetical protein